jgi:hypothetical protein
MFGTMEPWGYGGYGQTISYGPLDHSRHCRCGRGGLAPLAPTIRFFVMRAPDPKLGIFRAHSCGG